MNVRRSVCCVLSAYVVLAFCADLASGQGVVLQAGGAVNRGMGSATTGTAIDALGSMYWNPATINGFDRDEVAFGFELIHANQTISSSFPMVGSGKSEAETGAVPVPTIAWVHQTTHPDIKFGLGIMGVGGVALNIRADPSNPILSPPLTQGGVGVGGIKSDAQFFEVAPAWSLRLTERLSLGLGPVIGLGRVLVDENAFVPLNADGSYPRGDGTRYHWGLGAQLGFHYVHDCNWELGANLKSPVWFESFRFFSEDANGLPRTDKVEFDLPLILTTGLAYRGYEYLVLTADFRYTNFASADGFGDPATYQATGAANGLGWNDVFSMGYGAQAELTERLTGRLGYYYISKLFDDSDTFFNLASDLGYQHSVTCGASYDLNDNATVSVAYNYFPEWGGSGPYVLPGMGAIPGSSVSTDFDVHIVSVGLNVRY